VAISLEEVVQLVLNQIQGRQKVEAELMTAQKRIEELEKQIALLPKT